MSRPVRLPINKTSAGKWRYDLPPSMSSTGRRQRRIFDTKKQAELSRDADLERFRIYGIEGRTVHPTEAADAARAREILNDGGLCEMTLKEAARIAVKRHQDRTRSIPFRDVWTAHEDARSNKSAAYLRSLDMMRRKMLPLMGDTLVCDLNPEAVEEAITSAFPTAHGFNFALRTLSPAFSTAFRKGWCKENPCQKIEKRDTGRKGIDFLTVNESRNVLAACRDWTEDKQLPEWMPKDATPGLAAVALMLFAGIRPVEVTRLDWSDVDLAAKSIFVSNQKAKTDRSRYIEMPDALVDWLETVPEPERQGKVIPSQWEKLWKLIRRKAGIAGRKDVLRKTFCTYHLAGYGDVAATRAIMGHEVGDTLFSHYRGAVRKKDALQFWSIRPEGAKPAIREAV